MKKLFEGLFTLFLSVIGILNFSSGIIAAIWLIAVGGWQFVLFGFILGIAMPWVYSIASIPSMLVVPLILKFAEKGNNFLVSVFGFIASLYNNFLLALWVSFVFGLMIQVDYNPIAMWFWGFATIMGPISYMASKEDRDSLGTVLGAFFCQVGYILLTVSYYFFGSETLGYSLLWLSLIAFSGLNIYLGFAEGLLRKSGAGSTSVQPLDEENIEEADIVTQIKELEDEGKKYCSSCGEKINKSSNFCTSCGASLKG